jgi:hypothetical protein
MVATIKQALQGGNGGGKKTHRSCHALEQFGPRDTQSLAALQQ